jgi:hypothetical protein
MRTLAALVVGLLAAFSTTPIVAAPYAMMFERTSDAGGGAEVAFRTYGSFADLLADNSTSTTFSPINVSSSFNTTGLAAEWQLDETPVPEPETLGLLGAGLASLAFAARRRRTG